MKEIFYLLMCLLCISTQTNAQAGALDTTFADRGKFRISYNEYPSYFTETNAVAIQADGKILIAGTGINYSNGNGSADFAIMRLNTDGTPDNSFNGNGKLWIDFSDELSYSYDDCFSIAIQPDGKILLAGYAFVNRYLVETNTQNYYDYAVARINTDGTLDNSFDGDGRKLVDLSALTGAAGYFNYSYDLCRAVIVKTNGKIAIAGSTYVTTAGGGSTYDAAVVQMGASGILDSAFGSNGIKIINRTTSDESIYSMALQKDGKLVLGGTWFDYVAYSSDMLAIRLKPLGSEDNSFDADGFATVDLGSTPDHGTAVIIQPDDKIVLGGYQYGDYYNFSNTAIARFNINGSLDNAFNGTGKQVYSQPGEYTQGWALSLQADGKIIQSGKSNKNSNYYYNYSGADNFQVLRYNADGTLDNSFGNFGRALIDFGNFTNYQSETALGCAVQSDAKIVVAGYSYSYNVGPSVARLLGTGKNVALTGPTDQVVETKQCDTALYNIGPILTPDTSTSQVKYSLYTTGYPNPYDSGYGSLNGKPFNIGSTTAIYSLVSDPLQYAVFTVNVTGGSPGGALDFDGIDDRVELGTTYPIGSGENGEYSFEAWIRLRSYNKQGSAILSNEHNNDGGILIQLDSLGYISTYHPAVGLVKSKYKVRLGKWTHIAFVQSATQLNLYVNGVFVQTMLSAPNLHVENYSGFNLGAYIGDYTNYSRFFDGQIDEVRLWSRAICQAQIQNNLNCQYSGYDQYLSAYYSFNQGLASCKNEFQTSLAGSPGYGYLQGFGLNGPTSNWVAGYVTGTCAPFTAFSVICPDPVYVTADSGQCSALVNFSATATSGCSKDITISYSQNPGTSFPIGTTYVGVTAQDGFGNTSYCQFPVIVTENIPPQVITKNISVALDYYGNAFINPYDVIESVSDNCGFNNYSVYAYPTYFNCNNVGDNVVTVQASDYSGNTTVVYAHVNVTGYAGASVLTINPTPQQYSDAATMTAVLQGAQNFYFNGCSPASQVTFKLDSTEIGTVSMQPDYYGNLVGSLNYQLLNVTGKTLTATFSGGFSGGYSFTNPVVTKLTTAPENADIEYIGSQLIESATSQLSIPVAAIITDTADGSRGDISKATVTFTIKAATAGASVIGASSVTVPAFYFLSADKTYGVAKSKFNVSTGGKSNAKFNVTVKVNDYYSGTLRVPVNVVKSTGAFVSGNNNPSYPVSKFGAKGELFDVSVSPNPSQSYYSIKIQSNNKYEKISVRITDVAGKTIETVSNVNAGDIIELGHHYHAGMYLAEITQGQQKKVLKLIKL